MKPDPTALVQVNQNSAFQLFASALLLESKPSVNRVSSVLSEGPIIIRAW